MLAHAFSSQFSEFKVNLVYIASSREAKTAQWDSVSNNTEKNWSNQKSESSLISQKLCIVFISAL